MTWSDITTYSRLETAKTPRILECSLTPHISFMVHKHIHYGDAWLLSAHCVNLECFDLETTDMNEAKDKACIVMSQKLLERQSELTTALNELNPKPAPRWVRGSDDQDGWYCSECGYEALPADWFNTPYEEGMNFCTRCGAQMKQED